MSKKEKIIYIIVTVLFLGAAAAFAVIGLDKLPSYAERVGIPAEDMKYHTEVYQLKRIADTLELWHEEWRDVNEIR